MLMRFTNLGTEAMQAVEKGRKLFADFFERIYRISNEAAGVVITSYHNFRQRLIPGFGRKWYDYNSRYEKPARKSRQTANLIYRTGARFQFP